MKDRFYDNTRVSSFRTCPRMFYYRHIRDWTPDTTSPPLAFGGSWHEGMDTVWEGLQKDPKIDAVELGKQALTAFMKKWLEEGMPNLDELDQDTLFRLKNRTPMVAYEMFCNYIDERRNILTDPSFELISVEQPFAVPLDPDDASLMYVGRLDKVFGFKGHKYVGEHKTTSAYKRDGGFRNDFLDSFSPNSQVDGYQYAAHILYGDALKAVWIDGALVHKTVHDAFQFIPVERQIAQLDSWLWETRYQIDLIEQNTKCSRQGDYMPCFPKNTSACSNYAGCIYRGLCKMWSNPDQHPCPPGFIESHWSPFEVLELQSIGLTNPDK